MTQTEYNWRLAVNVNRVPSGDLVGTVQFFAYDMDYFDRASIEARPTHLETSGDTACVIADVTRFAGEIGYTPAFLVVTIRDNDSGPDLFSLTVYLNEIPGWSDYCSDPPDLPVQAGEFTIIGNGKPSR